MRKLTRGITCLIIVCTLIVAQSFGMFTSSAASGTLTNRYFYGITPTTGGLYPTADMLPSYGWTGVSYTALAGGGTNISFNNYGSSLNCIGIDKPVKLEGLDLMMKLDTTKATAPNDQYFYINFCNGRQQNFWTNPFAIRINWATGQVVTFLNGAVATIDNAVPEVMNTTTVRIRCYLYQGTYYMVINETKWIGFTEAQLKSCNNFNNLNATYVTISPAENNTNFSMDVLYLHGGESPNVDDLMANVPAEQNNISNAADTIDAINAIGTVTAASESAIIAAQTMYNALGTYNGDNEVAAYKGSSYKALVFNYQKLVDATTAYKSYMTLTNQHFSGLSASSLYPTSSQLAPWGWGVTYSNLENGGVNVSYNGTGSSMHCVGINKPVKLNGLDLMMKLDTTKATTENDQYFYITMCNGLQQNFWTNPFGIRINHVTGQVVTFLNGAVATIDNAVPEVMNTTTVRIQCILSQGSYYMIINDTKWIGFSEGQLKSCNNFNNFDSTYVTIAPAYNDTNFSMDILYLHGGESPDVDDIMANVPAQQYQVVNSEFTIEAINSIGAVTANSGAAIATARGMYNALGSYTSQFFTGSYKYLVSNRDTLFAAEKAFFTSNWKITNSNLSGLAVNKRADATALSLSSLNPASGMSTKIFDGANEAAADKIVGTGMTVKTYQNDVLQNSYTAILYGDISGDGLIGAPDLILVKKHLLKTSLLANEFALAGDIANKGSITIKDLLLIKKDMLGFSPIVQH